MAPVDGMKARTAGTSADPLWERNLAICDLRRAGWSYERLAKLFGIVPERVRQIVSREHDWDVQ